MDREGKEMEEKGWQRWEKEQEALCLLILPVLAFNHLECITRGAWNMCSGYINVTLHRRYRKRRVTHGGWCLAVGVRPAARADPADWPTVADAPSATVHLQRDVEQRSAAGARRPRQDGTVHDEARVQAQLSQTQRKRNHIRIPRERNR